MFVIARENTGGIEDIERFECVIGLANEIITVMDVVDVPGPIHAEIDHIAVVSFAGGIKIGFVEVIGDEVL